MLRADALDYVRVLGRFGRPAVEAGEGAESAQQTVEAATRASSNAQSHCLQATRLTSMSVADAERHDDNGAAGEWLTTEDDPAVTPDGVAGAG